MPPSSATADSPIEGFALQTRDGLIFTVKGLVHPPDAIVAYLRYAPDPAGDRECAGRRFRRIYSLQEQREVLARRHPSALRWSPESGVLLQAVPRNELAHVYDPVARLADIVQRGPADELEATALRLTGAIAAGAAVSRQHLGLTGSPLFGLHRPSSDIDLVVYGEAACRAVHTALGRLLDDPSTGLRRPAGAELQVIHRAHATETPLSPAQFASVQARKVNEGMVDDRPFFVRFVKVPSEQDERWGDPRFEPCGRLTLRARIEEARDALFTPCRYRVTAVEYLDGAPLHDMDSIVSFRSRFSDQAQVGETVIARGLAESVISGTGQASCRLVVGGQAGDYLVPVTTIEPSSM